MMTRGEKKGGINNLIKKTGRGEKKDNDGVKEKIRKKEQAV